MTSVIFIFIFGAFKCIAEEVKHSKHLNTWVNYLKIVLELIIVSYIPSLVILNDHTEI